MQINPNVSTGGVRSTPNRSPVPAGVSTKTDTVSLQQAGAIQTALQQTPDVRAAAVARATELARDPTYPPLATIKAIGNLLALPVQEQQ